MSSCQKLVSDCGRKEGGEDGATELSVHSSYVSHKATHKKQNQKIAKVHSNTQSPKHSHNHRAESIYPLAAL